MEMLIGLGAGAAATALLLVLLRAQQSRGRVGQGLSRMSSLDAKAIKGFRQPGEDAETYLRRLAARPGRRIGPIEGHAVAEALREHFGLSDSHQASEGTRRT